MKPFPYEEILNLGPPQSGKHPKMVVADRAAQFAPFSALTGHGAALAETARLTERRCGRDDDIAVEIDRTLDALWPAVTVAFFVPDERKEGGRTVTESGRLKRIDEEAGCLILESGRRIAVGDIVRLEEGE